MSCPPCVSEALMYLQNGDWEAAHRLVAADSSAEAAWVHAHLHRVEGDLDNANYWYARAGRLPATGSLAEERAVLLAALTADAA